MSNKWENISGGLEEEEVAKAPSYSDMVLDEVDHADETMPPGFRGARIIERTVLGAEPLLFYVLTDGSTVDEADADVLIEDFRKTDSAPVEVIEELPDDHTVPPQLRGAKLCRQGDEVYYATPDGGVLPKEIGDDLFEAWDDDEADDEDDIDVDVDVDEPTAAPAPEPKAALPTADEGDEPSTKLGAGVAPVPVAETVPLPNVVAEATAPVEPAADDGTSVLPIDRVQSELALIDAVALGLRESLASALAVDLVAGDLLGRMEKNLTSQAAAAQLRKTVSTRINARLEAALDRLQADWQKDQRVVVAQLRVACRNLADALAEQVTHGLG